MNENGKTNAELIGENFLLKQRIKELEYSESRQKRTDEALQNSEEKYKFLIDTTHTGYVILTAEGLVIDANAEYVRISGHDRLDEILQRSVVEWTAEYDQARNAEEVKRCLASGFVRNLEIDYIGKHRHITSVEINANLIGSDNEVRIFTLCRDIGKRKAVENALRESEAKYRSLASTVDYLFLVDKDCRYLFANQAYLNIFGPMKDSVIGRKHNEIHDEEADRIFTDAVKYVLETGNAYQDEWLGTRSGRWLLRTFNLVKHTDERLVTITVSAKDITARKRVEEELQKSAENYRSLAATIDSLFVVDRNYIMIFANEHFLKRLKPYHTGPMIGESIDVIHHPSQAITIRKGVDAVFSTGKPHYDELWGYYTAMYFIRTFSPIFDEKGYVASVTVASKDMTERKRAEIALQQSEERYRSLASVADRVFVVDKDCRHLFANNAYLDTFGPERDSVIGRRYDEFNDEKLSRLFADTVRDVFETGDVYQYEFKGGRTGVDFLRRVSPIINREGIIYAVTVISIDITERKQLEKDLLNQNDILSKLVTERTADLEMRSKNLEEMNTALRVLLQKREEDKKHVEELIVSNIKSLVYPYVEEVKKDSPNAKQHLLLSIIETHLNELLSPLLKKLQQFNLTQKEIQVAAMVKDGRTTKEIAKMLGVETSSVDDHRHNLRKKLGLSRTENLHSKLQSLN